MLKFTKDHEWLRVEGDIATIGITDHAQKQLGDLVFVELPKIGSDLQQGASVAVVESVKAASDVFAPISGTVIEINDSVVQEPAKINVDAMAGGWFFKMKIADRAQVDALMDEAAYRALID